MLDFGYDVSDYRAIDPLFGSMDDFDKLVAALHKRKIKVLMDLVVNHTSDRHPWFIESRSSRTNPKRDWYIWHEGIQGRVPNNWQSVFGGGAWEKDEATGSFYMHSFLPQQPDLNWRNPEVKKAVFADLEFWLKKGVDGFRLDVVNLYYKDDHYRDNPLRLWGWKYPRPYEFQTHVYDMSRPEMHPLLKDLRKLLDKYKAMAVGEVLVDFSGDPALAASYLGNQDELHLAFDFTLLYQKWDAAAMARTINTWMKACGENWPTLVFNNHDQDRSYSRLAKDTESDARAKILGAILLTARGTPFLYYGEEIGMKNGKIARHELRDPVGIRWWPLTVSRDPARTPMLWNSEPGYGFTSGKPWLPFNDDAATRNLARQQANPDSVYHWFRALIALRKKHIELRLGDWEEIAAGTNVLAYRRTHKKKSIEVYLNFAAERKRVPATPGTVLLSNCGRAGSTEELAGYEILVYRTG